MDRVRRIVTLVIVILTVTSPHWVNGVKVIEAQRSFELSTYENELLHTNEVNHWNGTQENDTVKKYEDHLDRLSEKPSRFDSDDTEFIHTDNKDSHRMESERLTNSSISQERGNSTRSSPRCKNSRILCMEELLKRVIDKLSQIDEFNVTDSVQIVRNENTTEIKRILEQERELSLVGKIHKFAKSHVLKIRLPADFTPAENSRMFFGSSLEGKNSFLTGFGLGFLAFGLKKVLLPILIGVQIIKGILFALFLPSIIGSLGKIVGKSISTFSQVSQSINQQPDEMNFDLKDHLAGFGDDYMNNQPLGTLPASAMQDDGTMPALKEPEISSRYSFVDPRIPHANMISNHNYRRQILTHGLKMKKQDFKVFHEIPSSSLLLSNYDPFYSPLLSRLDAVFSRLGHTTEACREFVVCAMYRSPARYAPYSNLVSAQLSRELNELRKPSSDNPNVLRFFRYMKAAKDGQDGVKCEEYYPDCEVARDDGTRQNQAMLATYQDIDKLVHARKFPN